MLTVHCSPPRNYYFYYFLYVYYRHFYGPVEHIFFSFGHLQISFNYDDDGAEKQNAERPLVSVIDGKQFKVATRSSHFAGAQMNVCRK